MMTLEDDWVRLVTAFKKARDLCPNPNMFLFAHIEKLRKVDNKGIDFAIRRLYNSPEYGNRIRLHGGPSSTYPRYPLRVTHRRALLGTNEYKYILIELPELRKK